MSAPGTPARSADHDPGLGELLGRLTDQFSTLVRQEVELAKTEAKQEARVAARASALLVGAGVLGFVALLLLAFAAALALAELMPSGLAFLLTSIVVAGIAAVVGLKGRDRMQDVQPALPETTDSLRKDAQAAKEQTR